VRAHTHTHTRTHTYIHTYIHTHKHAYIYIHIYKRGCVHKFRDSPPGARTANGKPLCQQVQLYRYSISQSSEFCAITLSIASQCLLLLSFISLLTQSRNFWIHPGIHRPGVEEGGQSPAANIKQKGTVWQPVGSVK
jgi:hypothetical protein